MLCSAQQAEQGACTAALDVAPMITEDGGEAHRGFGRAPDGTIVGGWPDLTASMIPGADFQPTAPTGVPAADFAPTAPRMQCPSGWMARDGLCDAALSTTCAAGTGPLPGGACTATGADQCPATPFAIAPAGAVVRYVQAGAAVGGDGTLALPYSTLAEAVANAPDGAVLLLSAGTFAPVSLARALTIRGRCANSTRIEAPMNAVSALDVRAMGARIEGVTLSGGSSTVSVAAMASLSISNCVVRDGVGYGVRSSGALTLDQTWITAINDHTDGSAGVLIESMGEGTLRSVSVTAAARIGVSVRSPMSSLRDVAVLDAGLSSMAEPTAGIELRDGGATLERVAVTGCKQYGVLAAQASSLTANDLFVARTIANASAGTGRGVDIEGASESTVRRLSCERNRSGCFLNFSRLRSTLEDVVVRAGSSSFGLYFSSGNSTVLRAEASGVAGAAVVAARGAQATVTDLVVHDAAMSAAETGDVSSQSGATLVLERVRVGERNRNDNAMLATGARSRLTVRDALVFGSVASNMGGAVEATRVRVRGNGAMVVTSEGTGSTLRLEDAAVSPDADNTMNARVASITGAVLTLTRVVLDARAGTGVTAEGGRAQLTDVVVRSLLALGASRAGASLAVGATARGQIDATRLRTELALGVHVGAADASQLRVSQSLMLGEGSTASCDSCVGAAAITGASIELRDARFERVTGTAIGAEQSSTLMGERVLVRAPAEPAANPSSAGFYRGGLGVLVRAASTATLRGFVIDGATNTGMLASQGSTLTVRDTLLTRSQRSNDGMLGWGIGAVSGSRLDVRGVLVDGAFEGGVLAVDEGTTATLSDVLVRSIAASARGLGWGVAAVGGASLTASRVAVDSVQGIALGAVPNTVDTPPATLVGEDLFVRDVRPGALRATMEATPDPNSASAAIVASDRSSVTLRRSTVLDCGYAFYNDRGSLSIEQGVVSGMLDAVGAYNQSPPQLSAVWQYGNANNGVVSNATLGDVSFALPTGLDR